MTLRGQLKIIRQLEKDGWVRSHKHKDHPLTIYNYTHKCQSEGHWNKYTKMCRGLILEDVTGKIIARPFGKFFNWNEESAEIGPGECRVYDKLDGSLFIVGNYDGKLIFSTRGGFESDQCKKGTEIYMKSFGDSCMPIRGSTHLFEVIYPGNRIVVDYGDSEKLVFLGAICNDDGHTISGGWAEDISEAYEDIGIHSVEFSEHKDIGKDFFSTTLENPIDNTEGFVIHWLQDDMRVKIKFDEYVRLHRILTGVTKKRIWEMRRNGDDIGELLENVPDEFYKEIKEIVMELQSKYTYIEQAGMTAHELVRGLNRRNAAKMTIERCREYPEPFGSAIKSVVFKLLDDREYSDVIWKALKPKNDLIPNTYGDN